MNQIQIFVGAVFVLSSALSSAADTPAGASLVIPHMLFVRYNDSTCATMAGSVNNAQAGIVTCSAPGDCSGRASECLVLNYDGANTYDQGSQYCSQLVTTGNTFQMPHLVTLLTDDKLKAVQSFLNGLANQPPAIWTSLRSTDADCSVWDKIACGSGVSRCGCKTWKWNGSPAPTTEPKYWAPGQPSGVYGISIGECAKMSHEYQWRYFDDPCTKASINSVRGNDAVLCEATVN